MQNENSCGFCFKKNQSYHNFVNCALCKSKIHIKCNNIERGIYNKMDSDKEISICINCNKENFPFYTDDNISESYNKEFLASDTIKGVGGV